MDTAFAMRWCMSVRCVAVVWVYRSMIVVTDEFLVRYACPIDGPAVSVIWGADDTGWYEAS